VRQHLESVSLLMFLLTSYACYAGIDETYVRRNSRTSAEIWTSLFGQKVNWQELCTCDRHRRLLQLSRAIGARPRCGARPQLSSR
jgi:hypothetical protein